MPTSDPRLAAAWISRHNGWGTFTASELLTKKMATWIGLWYEGQLIASQGRERLHWEYASLSPSGVTGITGAQVTTNAPAICEVARKAIDALPFSPHGIVSVDLTYDRQRNPNPTEIQASRFYTSILFLATAGLNLPDLYIQLALTGNASALPSVNPLPDGLLWLKSVDCQPQLTTVKEFERQVASWSVATGVHPPPLCIGTPQW